MNDATQSEQAGQDARFSRYPPAPDTYALVSSLSPEGLAGSEVAADELVGPAGRYEPFSHRRYGSGALTDPAVLFTALGGVRPSPPIVVLS